MSLGPGQREARRAQLRARQLRRRLIALCALLVVVGAAVGVAVASGGGSGGSKVAGAGGCGARANCESPPPTSARAAPQPAAPASNTGTAEIRRLIALGRPIYCAGPHGNAVAFTFDDGPGPYTHYAIKKLTQSGQRATFFAVGKSIDVFPRWLSRELKVAVIGNHTYTHPELPALSPSEVRWQLEATKLKIEAQSGQPVDLWRPPYELRTPTIDRIGQRLGLLEILWNVDSRDSVGADWSEIIANVEAGLWPGAIILMHENHGQTIRALTTLLPELHHRHLRSVSIPELLAEDPPSIQQVRLGPQGCPGIRTPARGSGG